jgi:hypothetical protein
MIIGKMKYFIGKMVWINEIEIIRIGKMFQYIKLNIYMLPRGKWNSMRIMKNLIGKMVWINETGIIRIGKMFQYVKLDIYILTRKMKFNANNEKFSWEKWFRIIEKWLW